MEIYGDQSGECAIGNWEATLRRQCPSRTPSCEYRIERCVARATRRLRSALRPDFRARRHHGRLVDRIVSFVIESTLADAQLAAWFFYRAAAQCLCACGGVRGRVRGHWRVTRRRRGGVLRSGRATVHHNGGGCRLAQGRGLAIASVREAGEVGVRT